MSAEVQPRRIPLRITDTTLRDAHQSLWATRMLMEDVLGIIDTIDNAGYYSLEVWGGATFDVCLRYLRENPWERLRKIKEKAKKTPLQMLLRGQNIVGYKNYPDDLVDRFVALAAKNGIDIFRVFDALNDTRNLEAAIRAVKKYGGHAQGTICYTLSPVHTVEKYVEIGREQKAMGIDSICIKDMAGLLSPIAAENLVSALITELELPVQIHSHATSGMATATYVEGVRAGAGAIDCAISSMSGFSSQPPVETIMAIFEGMPYHAQLDLEALKVIAAYFRALAPSRQLPLDATSIIDPGVLVHHIPGGMISNLRSQLEQQKALDRLPEVLAELPKVREEMGFPPLVTPTSQIVGVQAVMNVLSNERYSMISEETKNYVRGLYGRSPAPIDPVLKKKILGKDKVIKCRPADLLEPILPTATNDIDPDLIEGEEDILSYCLFPEIALDYFKWRKEPHFKRAKRPVDVELENRNKKADAVPQEPAKPMMAPSDYKEISALIDKVKSLNIAELTIRTSTASLSLKGTGGGGKVDDSPFIESQAKSEASTASPEAAPQNTPEAAAPTGLTINAPISGTLYTAAGPGKPPLVKEGDVIKEGTVVCIVEAMKMFNQIKVSYPCKVVRFLTENASAVTKDQPLLEVEKI